MNKTILRIVCCSIAYGAIVEGIQACSYYFYFTSCIGVLGVLLLNKKHWINSTEDWLKDYSKSEAYFSTAYSLTLMLLFLFNNMYIESIGFLCGSIMTGVKLSVFEKLTKEVK